VEVVVMDHAPGEVVAPGAIRKKLEQDGALSAVLLTHCETSTGALNDIESAARSVHEVEKASGRQILVVADCTSSLLVDELRTDDWGLDCVLAASQKGLLAPPGLGLITLGPRARKALDAVATRRFYLDLRSYFGHPDGVPFTPAVGLVCAAQASLDRILGPGVERVWKAYRASAEAVTVMVGSAGFETLAARQSGAAITFLTGALDATAIALRLKEDHGLLVGTGRQELEGRVLRVSPLGRSAKDMLELGAALESVLRRMGRAWRFSKVETQMKRLLEDYEIWE
jgi:aspartate aminotransferase-like enzyme